MSVNNHNIFVTINWFLRWLATPKLDLFIWELPSELVTQIKKHPLVRILNRQMKLPSHWRMTSQKNYFHTNGRNYATAISPEEMKNKYCWAIWLTSSQLGILVLFTIQPNSTTTKSTTNTTSYDVTQHVSPLSQALDLIQVKLHNESWRTQSSVWTRDKKKPKIHPWKPFKNILIWSRNTRSAKWNLKYE